MIHAHHRLVVVVETARGANKVVSEAREVRLRIEPQDLQPNRADQVWRNYIELSVERELLPHLAAPIGIRGPEASEWVVNPVDMPAGEPPVQIHAAVGVFYYACRNRGGRNRNGQYLPPAFKAGKEICLALADWTAEGASKLVLVMARARLV